MYISRTLLDILPNFGPLKIGCVIFSVYNRKYIFFNFAVFFRDFFDFMRKTTYLKENLEVLIFLGCFASPSKRF